MQQKINEILHEYITEYVEGTMDPVVRKVFCEYLEQNHEVKQFVQKAEKGRKALQSLSRKRASANLKDRIKRRIARDDYTGTGADFMEFSSVQSLEMNYPIFNH